MAVTRALPGTPPSRRRAVIVAAGSVVVAVLVTVAALFLGPSNIPWTDIVGNVLSHVGLGHSVLSSEQALIIWQVRAPEVVLAVIVGAMLAVAGGSYQGVFRNPLSDPYLLGIAAGAGLGATIAIVDVGHGTSVPTFTPWVAFAGALFAVSMTWAMSGRGRRSDTATLILAGVAISSILTSVQMYLQQTSNSSITTVYLWLLGSLSGATWPQISLVLPYVIGCTLFCIVCARALDVLSVGDLEARSLGLRVTRIRLLVVVAASLGTAAVVSVAGLIGFVGLVVPHMVRLVVGTSYRRILPICVFVGAAFLVICDTLARALLSGAQLPIGIVTAAVGAPVFVLILNLSRRPVT